VGRLEADLPTFLGIGIIGIEKWIAMKWFEIITLRSPSKINAQFIDGLLKGEVCVIRQPIPIPYRTPAAPGKAEKGAGRIN
jgi:hypothetical protein